MRKIKRIIIHCSATRPDWMENDSIDERVKEIKRWHTEERNFNDIGYHFIISQTGMVADGRPVEIAGAHSKGNNADSIGICLLGGFGGDATDRALEHYTADQLASLWQLIGELKKDYGRSTTVHGHNEFSNKACPSFNVARWMAGQTITETNANKPVRKNPVQSKTVKASAVSVAASAGSAASVLGGMDQYAQYLILGFCGLTILLGIYIMRERVKSWAEGWR